MRLLAQKPTPSSAYQGFTLAELLVSLAILGVIATFTIPKILSTQQNSSFNAKGKEVASMISSSFTQYATENQITASFSASDLTNYMNYISVDVSSPMDGLQTQAQWGCSGSFPCLKLHNGGLLRYHIASSLGVASNRAIWFVFDPDGQYSGTTNGTGMAIMFFLYPNGRITTIGNILPSTCTSFNCFSPDPTLDPPWFSWN